MSEKERAIVTGLIIATAMATSARYGYAQNAISGSMDPALENPSNNNSTTSPSPVLTNPSGSTLTFPNEPPVTLGATPPPLTPNGSTASNSVTNGATSLQSDNAFESSGSYSNPYINNPTPNSGMVNQGTSANNGIGNLGTLGSPAGSFGGAGTTNSSTASGVAGSGGVGSSTSAAAGTGVR